MGRMVCLVRKENGHPWVQMVPRGHWVRMGRMVCLVRMVTWIPVGRKVQMVCLGRKESGHPWVRMVPRGHLVRKVQMVCLGHRGIWPPWVRKHRKVRDCRMGWMACWVHKIHGLIVESMGR